MQGQGRTPEAPFTREGWSFQGITSPYEIGNVAPPLATFDRGARAVGFVSVRSGFDRAVEVLGKWHGKPVASLQWQVVELALDSQASLDRGVIAVGDRRVRLDPLGRVPCDVGHSPSLERYGIDALLGGSIPRAAIEGRVVVLGYGRKDAPTVQLGSEKVGVHEAFNLQVSCLYRALTQR